VSSLRLASRGSRLALAQAELAATALRGLGHAVAIVPISTAGDRDRRRTFAELGGRGIFVREVEQAVLDGRADVAVHSAKDLTGEDDARLVLAVCLERADPRDAWCGPARSLADVPAGARVGTASLRRASQLRRLRADLRVEHVRGNVETRLRKRVERGLDAVVLAACGLDRLGLGDAIGFRLEVDDAIPESGQGIVALQTRAGDEELVAPLDHALSHLALRAERACTRRLAGGCTVPVAAYAQRLPDGSWRVDGYLGAPDGSESHVERREGPDPVELGAAIADTLLARGGALLAEHAR
jgi:hydroxymethylbilane synthase